jgi:hypothetical protein
MSTRVLEAGCKVIVGNRTKRAGMHLTKNNAEGLMGIRCAMSNGGYWDRDFFADSAS